MIEKSFTALPCFGFNSAMLEFAKRSPIRVAEEDDRERIGSRILVSQDSPRFERFLRNDDPTWNLEITQELDQFVWLTSIGVSIPLTEDFLNLEFSKMQSLRPSLKPEGDQPQRPNPEGLAARL